MAGKIKISIFIACLLPVLTLTAAAQEGDETLQLKTDNTLPQIHDQPPAPSAESDGTNGVAADKAPAMQPEQGSADKAINGELPASSAELDRPVKTTKNKRAAQASSQRFSSNVTVGAALVQINNPSAQFGKFTGVSDNQFYMLAAANVQSREGVRYWNLKADDIGLDNQSLALNGGSSGNYKFHFGYSELSNLLSNNSQTPFNGAGGTTLTLPDDFDRKPTTALMTNLAANMKSVDLGTKRKEGDASFAFELNKNFGLSFSFRRYLKDGVKSMGSVMLPDLLGPVGIILPEPVNYHTNEFRTGLDWHGERGQANLEYYYSRFSNNDASLTWSNPFLNSYPDPYPEQGRNSLPPDNQHQRLTLSGSFRLASATRLSALIEQGTMTQNEAFLPYTINPDAASSITAPMPRSSADARIDTTLVKLDLATQPLSALSLHAGYRHYVTGNKTPRNLYQMVINDTLYQVPVDSKEAQYNLPLDYSQNQFTLDSSYNFGKGTTLKLGYDRDQKDYRYRAVNTINEDTYTAKLNKRWDAMTVFVNTAYGRKRADSYDQVRDMEHGHSSEYLNNLKTNSPDEYFDSLPGMRQFDVAERDRLRQGLGVTLLPRQDLTLGLNANRIRDEYNASQFGLQAQSTDNFTVDATLTPDELQSWSLYYTRQNMMWQQTNRAYDSFDKIAGSSNPANDWSAKNKDVIDTVGINITMTFFDDKLPIQLSYAYSNIKTDISFTADPASIINTPPTNMPTLRGKRQTLDLSGTYDLRDNMAVRAGVMVETYHSSDWATDGFPPGSSAIPDVLTLSGSATPYRAFVLSTTLNYRF